MSNIGKIQRAWRTYKLCFLVERYQICFVNSNTNYAVDGVQLQSAKEAATKLAQRLHRLYCTNNVATQEEEEHSSQMYVKPLLFLHWIVFQRDSFFLWNQFNNKYTNHENKNELSERAKETCATALALWLELSQATPNYKALPALHKQLVDAYVRWCDYDLVQRLALHRQYLVSQDYYDKYGHILQFVCSREALVHDLCLLPTKKRLEKAYTFLKTMEDYTTSNKKPISRAWTEWKTEQECRKNVDIMPEAQFRYEVAYGETAMVDVMSGCGKDENALWQLVRMDIGPIIMQKIRLDFQNLNFGVGCGMFMLLRVLQEIKNMAVVTGVGSSKEWDKIVDCISLAGKFVLVQEKVDLEALLEAMLHIVQAAPTLTQAQGTRINMEWSNEVLFFIFFEIAYARVLIRW